jgi:hypothetical protein
MGAYAFDETFADSKASTTIPCLGIHNPMDPEGKRYDNLLKLTVSFPGLTLGQTVDISDEIAKHIDEAEVSVALDVEVALHDTRDGNVTATVTVREWDDTGISTEFH